MSTSGWRVWDPSGSLSIILSRRTWAFESNDYIVCRCLYDAFLYIVRLSCRWDKRVVDGVVHHIISMRVLFAWLSGIRLRLICQFTIDTNALRARLMQTNKLTTVSGSHMKVLDLFYPTDSEQTGHLPRGLSFF